MKVLNLYSGLGGNRFLWPNELNGEKIEVTAVETNEEIADYYMTNHPQDRMVIGDAHRYLEKNFQRFDIIWSSPPCQTHSSMFKSGRNRRPRFRDYSLWEEIEFLGRLCKSHWVVENVRPAYDPFIPGVLVGRHYLWSSHDMSNVTAHKRRDGFINKASATELAEWLGMPYEKNIYYDGNNCQKQVLRNCVHPITGLAIFASLAADYFGGQS